TLERAIRLITRSPSIDVAGQFDLDIDRVAILPAGIMILEEISDLLAKPLRVGKSGLREGIVLELLASKEHKTPKNGASK
ncbi:MAG: hypothetical protein JHC87_10390, partial [Thermoleophilaceae bacterium]|nr:hypothetical protein [Thermoleophilaceae bacterium]